MANRPFPSYWMYKDVRLEWRWTYQARNGEMIAVSSEGYKNRSDCEHAINLMRTSTAAETWMPTNLVSAS